MLAAFRRGLHARRDRYVVPSGIEDIDEAKQAGKLAVTFDLEGTEPLDGEPALLESFHALGVRTVLIAYNRRNRAGGGCHDDPAIGLTAYGRELVSAMNELGILVDATHCSLQTTFDLFEASAQPVVFSHSVPAAVRTHERNITDEQMLACAATGGVIGIDGGGDFPRPERRQHRIAAARDRRRRRRFEAEADVGRPDRRRRARHPGRQLSAGAAQVWR